MKQIGERMEAMVAERDVMIDPGPEDVILESEVPISKIFTDYSYSRPIDQQRVKRMASSWDWLSMGVIYLSLRIDGYYACLDGNHRIFAIRKKFGNSAVVPARVYLDLTIEQEAILWDRYNGKSNRKQPAALDQFRARLRAGEPRAQSIHSIVEQAGMELMLSAYRQNKANQIVAVTALDEAYGMLGPAELLTVLRMLDEAFGDDLRAVQSTTIAGLATFWHRYKTSCVKARVIDVLKQVGATQMLSKAHAVRAIYPGLPVSSAWARTLLDLYNLRLRSGRLPEWQDRGARATRAR